MLENNLAEVVGDFVVIGDGASGENREFFAVTIKMSKDAYILAWSQFSKALALEITVFALEEPFGGDASGAIVNHHLDCNLLLGNTDNLTHYANLYSEKRKTSNKGLGIGTN
jgi:hypothetical protein